MQPIEWSFMGNAVSITQSHIKNLRCLSVCKPVCPNKKVTGFMSITHLTAFNSDSLRSLYIKDLHLLFLLHFIIFTDCMDGQFSCHTLWEGYLFCIFKFFPDFTDSWTFSSMIIRMEPFCAIKFSSSFNRVVWSFWVSFYTLKFVFILIWLD